MPERKEERVRRLVAGAWDGHVLADSTNICNLFAVFGLRAFIQVRGTEGAPAGVIKMEPAMFHQ